MTSKSVDTVEDGSHNVSVERHIASSEAALVQNPTWKYYQQDEHLHGFLSRQFPTIANPAPLGLCSFALTTFCLSMINAGGLVSIHSSNGVVMGMAMFYGGLVQLLAGMWEFKTGNVYGSVAFSSYGGFWLSFAALHVNAFGFLNPYKTYPEGARDLRHCLGIYLLAWSMFSLLMAIAAHRATVCLTVLLFLVFLTFIMLAINEWTENINFHEAGGCFGVMAAFLAWYSAFASMFTNKNSLFTLPVGELDPMYRKWGWLPNEEVKI